MSDLVEFLRARLDEDEQVARHDPARVLAEVESKRRILDDCLEAIEDGSDVTSGATLAHRILRRLTLSYASHPDCRDEWRLERWWP